ncbi:exocyst complex component 7 [Vigna unguiculata]|uniref:Exocyst subunit Exo70 family protein n=1 Tax=Vigna unguiculata TaxID=3917 RepID=A0A4D6MHN0_VIGUN|nr:exocyst complex component 7 [Vigna unguiculata]
MTTLDIQLTRWLKQTAVWRFVGFFSTVVGLVCYGRSSSFTLLFGEWSLFKIFLYTVFSLFVCFWSLHAKVCPRSKCPLFKAHSALLLLTITSVYSYFTDKAGNGKPDVYSLISCVAFAIMSFSLSRQTQCGFEVDLLNFFLGFLILLLMKIKLALAVVGVGFSYALIILRSSLDTTSYENCGTQDEHSVVIDMNQASVMQHLVDCAKALGKDNSNLSNMLYEHVKECVEDYSKLQVIDQNFVIDALPMGKMNDLRKTIELMMGAGLTKECCKVYCNWRRESLKECLMSLLRFPEINTEGNGEGVEFKDYVIRRRLKAVRVALTILVPSERRLCDSVFSGIPSVADLCFTDVCRGATIQLLNIAVVTASGIHSNWRLFEILGMLQVWCKIIPSFRSLFPKLMVKKAMAMAIFQDELGKASMANFIKVGNMISHHPTASIMANHCGVLVTTINVMRYLISTCLPQQTSEHNVAGTSSSSVYIDRIMKHFERKLVAESKRMNPARRYLLMMNTWRFVELSAEMSGLDCLKKYRAKVQQNLKFYQSTWSTVLEFLKLENNTLVEPNAYAESLKSNINLFNNAFEHIYSTQSTWVVFDKQQREQIIMSLQNILLPAYGSFIGRFQNILGKDAFNHIRYGMFDIQNQLNNWFLEGTKMIYQREKEGLLKLVQTKI